MVRTSKLLINTQYGKNTNTFIVLFATIIAAITAYIIKGTAYDTNGKLVCSDYILNAYLYVIIAFCIIAMIPILMYNMIISGTLNIARINNVYMVLAIIIGLLLLLFACIYYIRNADPVEDAISIHMVYVIFCALFGILMSGVLAMGSIAGLLVPAIAIAIGLTTIAGYIGYYYGDRFITVDFDRMLWYALIGLVIWSIVSIFVISDPLVRMYATAIPGVIIFFLLLMSYNNQLRKSAEECTIPNYPKEALGLVTKIGNILGYVLRLLSGRRGVGKKLGSK